MTLLRVSNFHLRIGSQPIIDDVNLAIARGETLGLVGESGSGKSMLALSVMNLLPAGAHTAGTIRLGDQEMLSAPEPVLCDIRGRRVGMVFQEPMTALNPLLAVGEQVAETFRVHRAGGPAAARAQAAAILARVGLSASTAGPERYPHELSGGQRQRVVLAAAMALRPQLLIADEPTTALDVTTQARVLELLRELVRESETSLLLITHDLGVVAGMADRVAIMQEGRIVEHGRCPELFHHLSHPYSQKLLRAATPAPLTVTSTEADARSVATESVLTACNIRYTYRGTGGRAVPAVDDVSISIGPGERVGLVGESGSGKSTLARCLLGLTPPASGTVAVDGQDLYAARHRDRRQLCRQVQAVFQDPYGSFNPRHRIGRIVAEPLHLEGMSTRSHECAERVSAALVDVGLRPEDTARYPHQFSGGQRQRIAIARALILRPKVVVLDEPVSALDTTIREQILTLLDELNQRYGLAYLFISHDLTVVRAVAERTLVMHQGGIVESGATAQVLSEPTHPYTKSLIEAAPNLNEQLGLAAAP